MLSSTRKHLVIASFDGIVTHYCGVGEVVRNMVRVLRDIVGGSDLRISFAHVAADPNGRVFDRHCFEQSLSLARKTGGRTIGLSNGTAGFDEGDMWGSFPQWNHVSASLATVLIVLLRLGDDNILILHGTPFLLFAKFKHKVFGGRVRVFYFLHSTGLSHTFGDESWRRERIGFERECFSIVTADPDSHVVAVGDHFAALLYADYGVEVSRSCVVRNGLYFKDYEDVLSRKYASRDLARFGLDLPDDAKIIFSWGRCSEVKGFRELVNAWKVVQSELPDHYLVLQAPNNSGETPYFNLLRNLAASVCRTVLIDDFNPDIWRTVLRCSSTDIVCIPSLKDTNPLTAIEAKLFSQGMNYVIVASTRDGVRDSYRDGECFWINPSDMTAFAHAIIRASAADTGIRHKMSSANSRSMSNFDYSKNFRRFLEEFGVA